MSTITKGVRKIDGESNELTKVDVADRDGQGNLIHATYQKKSDMPTSLPANGGSADFATNAGTVNSHTVNSDVPAGAVFTDTWRGISIGGNALGQNPLVITAGSNFGITKNSDNSFTFSVTGLPTALPANGGHADTADVAGAAYNAGTVNNHTVESDVPANAKFTDTWRGITVGGTALTSSQALTISAGTGVTITNNGNGSFTVSSSNHVYKGTSSSTVYLSNALFKANHVYEIYPRNGNSTFTVYWRDANNNSISWTCSKLTVRVISKRTSHSSSYKQAIMLIWGDDFNYGSSNEDYAWFAQPRRQEVYGIQSNFYFSGYFNIYDMSN